MPSKQYIQKISQFLNVEQSSITLYSKGRVGLYTILKALDLNEGDEVIIPAFTCVVVANAIIYIGAKPVYVDIDPRTYNMDPSKVSSAITSRTKLIVAQNTFGLSPDFDALSEIGKANNINVIEDCTHGFGGTFKGKQNGTLSMASFYSTQWNKPFSTGVGGIVVANDEGLAKKIAAYSKELMIPSSKNEFILKMLIWTKETILTPTLYWTLIKFYRFLSKHKIVIGSSDGQELTSNKIPLDYFMGSGKTQALIGVKNLAKLNDENKHRVKLSDMYNGVFEELKLGTVFIPKYAKHTFIKFPFFVKDKSDFLGRAEKANIPLGEWFVSPIHPIEKDFELWEYHYGDFPIAEKISRHILNLPTDLGISFKKAEKICQFLKENVKNLKSYNEFY